MSSKSPPCIVDQLIRVFTDEMHFVITSPVMPLKPFNLIVGPVQDGHARFVALGSVLSGFTVVWLGKAVLPIVGPATTNTMIIYC